MAELMFGSESRDSNLISLQRLFKDAVDEVITRKRYINIGYVKFITKDDEEKYSTSLEFWKMLTSEIDQCMKELTKGKHGRNLIITVEVLEKKISGTYIQKLNAFDGGWLLFHYFPLKNEIISMLEHFCRMNKYSNTDKLNKILHEKLIKALQISPSNCHDPEICRELDNVIWNFKPDPNNPSSKNLARRRRKRLRARYMYMQDNVAPRFQVPPQQTNSLYAAPSAIYTPMYVPVAVSAPPNQDSGFYAPVPPYSTNNSLIPNYPVNATPTTVFQDHRTSNNQQFNNQFSVERNRGQPKNNPCCKTHCEDVNCDYEYCDDENCTAEHCNNEDCDCEHCDYELCEDEYCNDENCNEDHYYEDSQEEQPVNEDRSDENLTEEFANNCNIQGNRNKDQLHKDSKDDDNICCETEINENANVEGKEDNQKFDDSNNSM